ncbi:MAG: hypothetical protein HYY93_06060 [Planctomycetes bacterium]|nr:hypothetical protein [Planctomycetota bacterium]
MTRWMIFGLRAGLPLALAAIGLCYISPRDIGDAIDSFRGSDRSGIAEAGALSGGIAPVHNVSIRPTGAGGGGLSDAGTMESGAARAGAAPLPQDHEANWLVPWDGVVVGCGAPPEGSFLQAQARLMAMGAAELDAQRQLLARDQGVSLSAVREGTDFRMGSYRVTEKTEGMLRGSCAVARQGLRDGTARVAMTTEPERVRAAYTDTLRRAPPGDLSVPEATLFLRGVKAGLGLRRGPTPAGATGLVVDARGLFYPARPFPKIVDPSGTLLYALECTHSEAVRERGLVSYTNDPAAALRADRVGAHPRVVKAMDVREDPDESALVLSEEVAAQIRRDPALREALSECRVVVIID